MTTIKETLIRAKDLINEKGWTQGKYQDDDGCLCALGAIRAAVAPGGEVYALADWSDEQYDLMTASAAHLGKFVPVPEMTVHEYNDDSDSDKDDVIGLFARAIEAA